MRVRRPELGAKQCLIWDREHETMPRSKLEKLQLERLKKTVERCYSRIPFYKEKMDELGVKPQDIKSLKDVNKLPFTTKYDLRDNYPFEMFAEPMDRIVRMHASSGTTGKPVVVGYTAKDLDTWAELMARVYTSAGVTDADIVHNNYGYGLFTGGLGFHYGAERVGAAVVPVSGGLSKRQVMLWQDLGATVVTCTPSYALVLAEQAKELGVDPVRDLKLRVGFFGAEPWTIEMKRKIEEKLNLEAYDCYGLTEMIGPGVSSECPYHNGLHICEDHFLVETVDPDTGESCPQGSQGEMVITSLTKEGFPILRFRTRDRTIIDTDICACGRTTARMKRISGRTDDMLIIRGVNVFPSQIENVILTIKGLEPQYVIVVDRGSTYMDDLEVQVECTKELFAQGAEAMEKVQEETGSELHQILGLSARIKVVAPKTLERSEGKAKRVIDFRDLDH
ncbi:phenylacetate--CoA ligase family protein [Desulfosporosinus sp. BICA1-9]|uniref:phenylacetate--CoA ligase family protein n=1 Tax=Desulfosporosinus sp. BICA1-9 TaxID=1531958 RepID=UPI0005F0FD67|nr:phenylacetate--CoA ligase [Desulfosporosinus sp. BICA1-9]KJS47157.1 MAG: phenylacetate--CoA ligase [Peptococcaceae bacterium BRH_c23]KJS85981.1 MAG: phenylacetate--CoA ligase [Desulfosporosinus sp. BICA1-9]HBW34401.1 phenylacetate--CoA ligase family protein [Desulfosporosinus sp.]